MTPTPGTDTPFPTSSDLSSNEGRSLSGMGNGTPDLMSRVVQGAHQTIDQLAERAAPAVERMHQKGDELGVRADHLREVGDEWAESMRSTVRENPLAAVAVAVAVGMLFARITR
jgi:ElaB/YqjD/DUF883 family membrane-anchored ribosome-binding protein